MHNFTSEQVGSFPHTPPEVTTFADRLGPAGIYGTSAGETAAFRLEYGSGYDEGAIRHEIRVNLRETATSYRTALAEFIHIGQPGAALPEHIDRFRSYQTANNVRWDERPPFEERGWPMDSWLKVADEHMPEESNEVMRALVGMVEHEFNAAGYAEAIAAATAGIPQSLARSVEYAVRNTGHRAAAALTARVAHYGNDPFTVEEFLQSDFFAKYGDDGMRIRLQARLVELEPAGAAIPRLVEMTDVSLGNLIYLSEGSVYAVSTLIDVAPESVSGLIERHDKVADRIASMAADKILRTDESDRSAAHAQLLEQIETWAGGTMGDYSALLHKYRKHGVELGADRLDKLTELINTEYPKMHHENDRAYDSAASLVVGTKPAAELSEFLRAHPHFTGLEGTKAIAIRRLARNGNLAQALELVDQKTTTIDSSANANNPIENLFAIYEETGDQAVLAQAEARLDALRGKSFLLSETHLHRYAAHRYLGARRFGDEAAAQTAMAEMETYHTHSWNYVREQSLKLTMQMFLDQGEVDAAVPYARRLMADAEINYDHIHDNGPAARMAIVKAYMKAGRTQDAIDYAADEFFHKSVPHYTAMYAVKAITGKPQEYGPNLYAAHLDPSRSPLYSPLP